VVAGEVRTLAQRSATAAKEIKELIGQSIGRVSQGSAQVAEAGATMDEIVNSIKRVTDIMGEIEIASGEQSRGIEQVNIAVGQMDEVTQQNAALVEQASAAAQAMAEQATTLRSAISVFRVEGAAAPHPTASRIPSKVIHARKPSVTRDKAPVTKTDALAAARSDNWQTF